MVLHFKFKYLSRNGTLLKFLSTCVQMFPCEYKILKKNNFISLYVKANDDILEIITNKLSSYLPMSIYFTASSIQACENLPFGNNLEIQDDSILPYCTSCLNDVEDDENINYYNVFHSCINCGLSLEKRVFTLTKNDIELKYEPTKDLFEKIALLINENNKIKIKTFSGSFIFSKAEKINKNSKILFTNIDNISSVFNVSNQELTILNSIEKPVINLEINNIYKIKNKCEVKSLDIRLANDLILYFLSKELSKLNIVFIEYEVYNNNSKHDYSLYFESNNYKLLDIPKVRISNKKLVLLEENLYSE